MKVIINIPDDAYELLKNKAELDNIAESIIANGKPYEEREWIPVREKLPEGKINPLTKDFEPVLCSTIWDDVRTCKFGKPIGHSKAHFWSGGSVMDKYVIAWMPLPEPYKETENEHT